MAPTHRNSQLQSALLAFVAMGAFALMLADSASARRGRGGHDNAPHHHSHDFDQAREAVEHGTALPLSEIMVEVRKVIDGEILDVELLRSGPSITYRIRLLSARGTYHLVLVDAKTKTILKVEQQ